jgi:hypothetical protein
LFFVLPGVAIRCANRRIRGRGKPMQQADPVRRSRVATARQRIAVVLLLVVLLGLVWAARSGRYDREIRHLARGMQAGYEHAAGFVRRHLGR